MLESSDSRTRTDRDDDVQDRGTIHLFAIAMAAAVAGSSWTLARSRPVPRRPSSWWSGLALIWTGAAVNRRAKRSLGRAYRTRVTVVPGHAVVTDGPYRLVRHPMYAGSCLICVGAALAVDAPSSALWVLPVAALVRRIEVEEAVLSEALGPEYAEFQGRRHRLVPGVW